VFFNKFDFDLDPEMDPEPDPEPDPNLELSENPDPKIIFSAPTHWSKNINLCMPKHELFETIYLPSLNVI
jgi:hypothetical protein